MAGPNSAEELKNHVVICNCNNKVKYIVEELQTDTEHLDAVLIVQDAKLWAAHPGWHSQSIRKIIVGCPTDAAVLHSAGINQAQAAIILADPNHGQLADAPSTLTSIAIEKQNPQVHTVMELILSVNQRHLKNTIVNEIVCLGDISEKLLAHSCITPGIKNIFENLLTTEPESPQIFMPSLPEHLFGLSYGAISRHLLEKQIQGILIGFFHHHDQDWQTSTTSEHYDLVINPRSHAEPGKNTCLDHHDQLIIIAHQKLDLL